MSSPFKYPSIGAEAGAEFNDSGFLDQDGDYKVFVDSLLDFTTSDEGYNVVTEAQEDEGIEGDVFFNEAFANPFEQRSDFEDTLPSMSPSSSIASIASLASPAPSSFISPPPSAAPLEALSDATSVPLSNSLDGAGAIILNNTLQALPTQSASDYTPHPDVLATEPETPPDFNAINAPLTVSHFATSADAKAHRRRARCAPKSQATDVTRVKQYGREYWVRRIYNAMIDTRHMTDGESSIHRARFTQKLGSKNTFNALDLEATAHHIFDEAIAVHERGWNRPTVYHKRVVRGKLVDLSETSVEMRLSRICLCLQQKKSSVDDAIRGGVTLALLCDNPEARSFTKASNDAGNKKRGE